MMNNEDMPAMPYIQSMGTSYKGLTKREHFAGLAMQGLLADVGGTGPTLTAEFIGRASVALADALLKQLQDEG